MRKDKFKVKEKDKGQRLDLFLSLNTKITRSQIKKLFVQGKIFINGEIPKKVGTKINFQDVIEIRNIETKETVKIEKEKIEKFKNYKIDVIAEEKDYLVINKPAGLLVHPTQAEEKDTLVNWLLEKYPDVEGVGESEVRPGIVHRLDREASGLLVIARNQKIFKHLKKQFQDRTVDKEYSVLVYGCPDRDQGVIDFPIDRGKEGKMVSRPRIDELKLKNVEKLQPGKQALSEYWVEEELGRFSLLRVKIHTGRTHQIRVHMYAFGHPVVGDTLYMNKKLIKRNEQKLGRLFLQAKKLGFENLAGERVSYECELSGILKDYLKKLK